MNIVHKKMIGTTPRIYTKVQLRTRWEAINLDIKGNILYWKSQYMIDFLSDGSNNGSACTWMYINLADIWYGTTQCDISLSVSTIIPVPHTYAVLQSIAVTLVRDSIILFVG